jgi:hypothetical protein
MKTENWHFAIERTTYYWKTVYIFYSNREDY